MALLGSTTYGDGTKSTETSLGALPGGVNYGGVFDLARRLMYRPPQQPVYQQPVSPQTRGGLVAASQGRPLAAPSMAGGLTGPQTGRPMLSGLDAARQSAAMAEFQAASEPPPLNLTYPVGSAGFYQLDPLRMTGAQRQRFLPQNASVPDEELRRLAQQEKSLEEYERRLDAGRRLVPGMYASPWSSMGADLQASPTNNEE